jgi:hypothetical protein
MVQKSKKPIVQVHKGTSRFVLLFSFIPSLAVKLPRIHLKAGIETLVRNWRETFRKETWEYEVWWSPTWCLFKGLLDNWKEYRFYRKTKHQFLQTTYFSFLGIVNLQKRGQKLNCDYRPFWRNIYDATGGEAMNDGHHFSETDNFCVDHGVKILDYGSPITQRIILKHGNKIVQALASHFPELSRNG